MRFAFKTGLSAFALFASLGVAGAEESDSIQFNRDVRPILSNHCYACHGPDKNARKGKFRLDIKEEAYADRGGYYAIEPRNAEESELTLRVYHDDPEEVMPPPEFGKPITDAQRDILRRWIDEGAGYEEHWSFIQPKDDGLPKVNNIFWARNPIDRFVLSRLEKEGLQPTDHADKRIVLRRVYFDLVGLPPTQQELDQFLQDDRPGAYGRVVDRLMASPHYGERQALSWLDIARFTDTTGYHSDDYRKMFPYRDYVIQSFNDNKPYDAFTIQQLAGDLLPNPTQEDKIAAGYNRLNQITSEGGAQPKEYLIKYMADRVRNAGTVWLGMTMGCAECHDHKFDPVSTKEFYQFGAFFADIKEIGKYGHGNNYYAPFMTFPKGDQADRLAALEKEITETRRDKPELDEDKKRKDRKLKDLGNKKKTLINAMDSTLTTEPVKPRMVRVLPRGNWLDETGEVVEPGVPAMFPSLGVEGRLANRLDLAEWLVDGRNPLTARVYVNRVWHQFFGTGISKVLDDLGGQGEWPSHPELLDWLALEFQDSGWDMKHIVRLIVTSNTYRQSAQGRSESFDSDPYNRLLARQSAIRLPAELVRDNALSIAGLLEMSVGGESAWPYQPDAYYDDTYVSVGVPLVYNTSTDEKQYRRGLYTFWKRSFLHPSLLAFDAPPREECTAVRDVSNTPQQALVLLNDPTYIEAARKFGERILREGGADSETRIRFAYRTALSRDPVAEEIDLLDDIQRRHLEDFASNPDDVEAFLGVGNAEVPRDIPADELAAWTSVARIILNLHETITRY